MNELLLYQVEQGLFLLIDFACRHTYVGTDFRHAKHCQKNSLDVDYICLSSCAVKETTGYEKTATYLHDYKTDSQWSYPR